MSAAEFAGQAIVHALVAAGVVEALMRLWKIGAPGLRLGFRLLALAFPVLVLPAFVLLVPARRQEWFRDDWALFAGSRWGDLAVAGVGADALGLGLLSGLGIVLLGLDLVPFLAEGLHGRGLASRIVPEGTRAVTGEVQEVAGAMGIAAPPVVVLETPAPVLFCRGVRRPALVLSEGTVGRLDRAERRAALAHELAHLARRDPLLSWLLMAGRSVMFFNPVVQVVARAAVQETEWRADDLAVAVTRDPAALARGLVKLFRAGPGRWRIAAASRLAMPPVRARAAAVERRCRRLLDGETRPPVRFGGVRVGLTGLALAFLLFFVV